MKTFRQNIYKHLQQDWNDVLARVVTLWSPRTRAVQTKETSSLILSTSQAAPNLISRPQPEQRSGLIESEEPADESDSTDDGVLVTEEELIQLWLPGKIVHLYARRGVYSAVLVPRNFSDLRRILVQGNIFKDHSSMSIFESLQEVCLLFLPCAQQRQVRAARQAKCEPPQWIPYNDSESCKCCQNNFTWHSTFRGEAQQYRERS